LNGTAREAAHGKAGAALHEKQYFVLFDQIVNAGLGIAHGKSSLSFNGVIISC
jgi:hypothetical protein